MQDKTTPNLVHIKDRKKLLMRKRRAENPEEE
jgi:hypothetical protein